MRAETTNAAPSRAAIFLGGSRIDSTQTSAKDPDAREVRVRLEGCGVCASNLPVWEGRPWFTYPFPAGAPGHEGWGVIEALGGEVTRFQVGDRVALVSGNAYAQRDVADEGSVVKVPEALRDEPVPGEPLGCAMNIFKRSDIRAGHTVAIVGIGFIGALLTALSVRAGARVVALSRRSSALEMAERYGARSLHGMDDASRAVREVRSKIGQDGCDRVIEAVGNQQALDIASELIGVRGKLVVAGYHQENKRTVDMQRWNWLGIDVINAHERDPAQYAQGMREALDLIALGELDPTPLYTHRFALEEAEAAFRTLSARPDGFFKALIDCR